MPLLQITQDVAVALQGRCACGCSSEDMVAALALSQYLHDSGTVAAAIRVLEDLQSAPSSIQMAFDKNYCSRCHLSPYICCWVVS